MKLIRLELTEEHFFKKKLLKTLIIEVENNEACQNVFNFPLRDLMLDYYKKLYYRGIILSYNPNGFRDSTDAFKKSKYGFFINDKPIKQFYVSDGYKKTQFSESMIITEIENEIRFCELTKDTCFKMEIPPLLTYRAIIEIEVESRK
jgi:hypothetical protein